jgi:hypothetical protein
MFVFRGVGCIFTAFIPGKVGAPAIISVNIQPTPLKTNINKDKYPYVTLQRNIEIG